MLEITGNKLLTDLNTFGLKATCDRFVAFDNIEDLREAKAEGLFDGPGGWNVLGGGSNIIFRGDYQGTLFHPAGKGITVIAEQGDFVTVRVEAGTPWSYLTGWCVEKELWGLENLTGIPGLTGAAPVQNIGAYGVEAKDTIVSVETFSVSDGNVVTIAGEHCDFGYRTSVFKKFLKGKVMVTAVNLKLSSSAAPKTGYGQLNAKVTELGGPTIRNISAAVTMIRNSKLPDPAVTGNAGSFFKNPVVAEDFAKELKKEYPSMPVYPAPDAGCVKLAAGWLIDTAGWKGRQYGRAGVHHNQALVLVNLGSATAEEVLALAGRIEEDVHGKFGIMLHKEVEVI